MSRISDSGDLVSRRTVIGTAGVALAAPLVADGPAVAMAPVAPARPLGTLGDLARVTGAEGVGTQRGSLASLVDGMPLDARSHGVAGDGRTDDTRAVQALLDRCAAQGGRIAYFGTLRVRITGPLVSRGVGIVFDAASYGGPTVPGFIATGRGYTALTVVGSVADFCVTLTGEGGADISDDGRVAGDRRPAIDGIAFGTNDEPFAMSTVRSVRVNNLAGTGVRHAQCWDSTFLSVSVERCGTESVYAFDVAGDARRSCNETTWVRVHVEQSIGGSIRIDPGTLSCTFSKIHSERAIARGASPTWLFGGSCVYDSVRLTAANPAQATASIISNQADFRNLRAEQDIRVAVNASGGTVTFHNPGANLEPAPDQSGIVNLVGGVISILRIGAGWNLTGCQIGKLEAGFMPGGLCAVVNGCAIGEFAPQPGTDQAEVVMIASRTAAGVVNDKGRLRGLHLRDSSRFAAKGGVLRSADQAIFVDESSRIEGDLLVQRVRLRLAGTVTGALSVQGPVHDARATDTAQVGGRVNGWGAPTIAGQAGNWSANISATAEAGGERPLAGWRYAAGGWHPVFMTVGG